MNLQIHLDGEHTPRHPFQQRQNCPNGYSVDTPENANLEERDHSARHGESLDGLCRLLQPALHQESNTRMRFSEALDGLKAGNPSSPPPRSPAVFQKDSPRGSDRTDGPRQTDPASCIGPNTGSTRRPLRLPTGTARDGEASSRSWTATGPAAIQTAWEYFSDPALQLQPSSSCLSSSSASSLATAPGHLIREVEGPAWVVGGQGGDSDAGRWWDMAQSGEQGGVGDSFIHPVDSGQAFAPDGGGGEGRWGGFGSFHGVCDSGGCDGCFMAGGGGGGGGGGKEVGTSSDAAEEWMGIWEAAAPCRKGCTVPGQRSEW